MKQEGYLETILKVKFGPVDAQQLFKKLQESTLSYHCYQLLLIVTVLQATMKDKRQPGLEQCQ